MAESIAIQEDFGPDYGLERIDLTEFVPQASALDLVPGEFALRRQVFPLMVDHGTLVAAISSIQQLAALDELSVLTDMPVRAMLADAGQIRAKIEDRFLAGMMADMPAEDDLLDSGDSADLADLERMAGEAAVVQMVNLMFAQAVRDGVSDIHIEPYEREVKVRFRTDGILTDVMSPPKHKHAAIVSRVKILGEMNIAERRLPQDGRIKVTVAGRSVDVRVSIIPTVLGERCVMRILDKGTAMLGLTQLGMRDDALERFRKLINVPYGMVLVTGPTGSGKSTTLYAALQEIYSPSLNILTIEDPVEYQVAGIGQIQVRANIGLTFASGLRSIVRQDPDVIMVGEIRDHETAEIAIHAALTGHLVFSTLHTNDAPSAITRLLDMGVEPYLAASSIVGVLAQRLVRLNCPNCSEPVEADYEALQAMGISAEAARGGNFMQGKGCERCGRTGYKGRRGVYELMGVDEEIRRMTVDRVSASLMRDHAMKHLSMRTLLGDGRIAVLEGLTTPREVLRVCQRDDL
ncbi:MAG: Flp pilus assembly complex ATPase component TadA [Fimbriimonadaceae bacterium]|nr:Flp pilus assembly complex ATPase component TadA [Fimbriimonadaceae bacterium]